MSKNLTNLPNGIQSIALSFSGGGFRAAAFTLGCSSYLQAVPYEQGELLQKVKFISSTSGGSITNLMLAYYLSQGKSFEACYERLLELMEGTKLLDDAMIFLTNDSVWEDRPTKSRNLINAFAMVYDRDYFSGGQFASLFNPVNPSEFFIEEICANTTDFDNGLNFRFGTKGEIGNKYLKCSKKVEFKTDVHKIKLADILASSSCFPAGFEPIMYPKDFSWQNGNESLTNEQLEVAFDQFDAYNNPDRLKIEADNLEPAARKKVCMGLMDGGIDDNQGIYAFLLADERQKSQDFDFYLPCDVSSNYLENPFEFPEESKNPALAKSINSWFLSLKKAINTYVLVTAGIGLIGGLLLIFTQYLVWGAFLTGMFATALIIGVILNAARKKIKNSLQFNQSGTWVTIFKKYASYFLELPLSTVLNMLASRAISVLLLVDTIYLKKIRRLSYSYLYSRKANDAYDALIKSHNENPSIGKIEPGALWTDRVGLTAVYQLSTKNEFMLHQSIAGEPWEYETSQVSLEDPRLLKDFMVPSKKLRDLIDNAAAMDTTLWFDENHVAKKQKESLIIAGQATMCFTFLRIVYRFTSDSPDWDLLKNRLIADWQKFQTEPDWLYGQFQSCKSKERLHAITS